MPKKSDATYIQDMLTYARRASDRVRGLSRDDFEATVSHQESVAYNLMIVGEAASKLSEETRANYPTIPGAKSRACETRSCTATRRRSATRYGKPRRSISRF